MGAALPRRAEAEMFDEDPAIHDALLPELAAARATGD